MVIQKVYFDMDGVLADFDRGVRELCLLEPLDQANKTEADDDIMWAAIKDVEHFYNKLELMPGAMEMYKEISSKYDVEILSGIPKARRGITTAGEDKTLWTHRILSEQMKVNIVYREEKKAYAVDKHHVLIDDLKKNVDEWEEAGGTGILFTTADDVLEKIRAIVIVGNYDEYINTLALYSREMEACPMYDYFQAMINDFLIYNLKNMKEQEQGTILESLELMDERHTVRGAEKILDVEGTEIDRIVFRKIKDILGYTW